MYHIGVDLGGTNMAAGITDEDYRLLVKESIPTRPERGADAVLADMAALCLKLISAAGLTVADFAYAGVAAPGIANQTTGVVEYNNNLGFIQVPVAERLKALTGLKAVYLENDANAAALGEALAGAGKGAGISVMITLGTGIGGGVVLNGQIMQGAHHTGGELGHIVMEHRNGRPCTCGRRGCWEAYCSSVALTARTREIMREHPESAMWAITGENPANADARTAFRARKQGDAATAALIDEYMDDLACGLATVINIFDPDVVCLGGGISHEGPELLEMLIPRVSTETYGYQVDITAREKKRVRLATLGNDAGIIGAAWLKG